jgi:para-aminobenzoate synthetase component I
MMNQPLPSFVPHSIHLADHQVVTSSVTDRGFLHRAQNFVSGNRGVVLLSGGQLDCSRYSLAAWEPFLVFRSKGTRLHLWSPQEECSWVGNPLVSIDALFARLRPDYPLLSPPFSGGALGYFAYDLKNCIEHLPQTARDDLHLPDLVLFFPRHLLIHDRLNGSLHRLTLSLDDEAPSASSHQGELLANHSCAQTPIQSGALQSNFTHPGYLEAIRRIREYIRAGDVYQVNLSQRFQFPFAGSPFQLWKHLYELNPAPFYAYVDAGDHQVLSTSMERFIYRQGNTVETRPIKGTRRRGKDPAEDEALRLDLLHNPKDDAELSMIVDLLRNDLGRICHPRTVRIAAHKRLESYQNVHHLVSIVTGELRAGISIGDILRATFPGGSITGCPKIRAMEIIDELEPTVRHVYTGAMGYVGWHDNIDLNIAIRTVLAHKDRCYFAVGGGVVYDSNEEDEYQETLDKARTLFDLMERLERNRGLF